MKYLGMGGIFEMEMNVDRQVVLSVALYPMAMRLPGACMHPGADGLRAQHQGRIVRRYLR